MPWVIRAQVGEPPDELPELLDEADEPPELPELPEPLDEPDEADEPLELAEPLDDPPGPPELPDE